MTENVKEPPPGLTQERLDEYSSGKITINDFNETEKSQIDEYARTGTIETEDVAEGVKEAPSTNAVDKEPDLDPDLKAVKEKYYQKSVEANRNQQLIDNARLRETKLQEQIETLNSKVVTKPTDDNFDDDTQKYLRESLEVVKEQMKFVLEDNKRLNSELLQSSQKHSQDIETERGNLSIDKLQRSFPQLKTSVPVDHLNNELARFAKEVGGMDNVNKCLEDAEFMKKKQEEGISPLSTSFMENLDKFNQIVDINNKYSLEKDNKGRAFKDRNPDVGIENFYMNDLQNTGKFNEMLSNAKLTGANSVIDKVVSQKSTAVTMKPSTGADLPETGMTETQAYNIVKEIAPKMKLGQKLNPEQQERWDQYKDYVASKRYGVN